MKSKALKLTGLFFALSLIISLVFAFALNASAEEITPCPEGTCTYQNGICSLCGGYQAAKKISESHYPEYNSTHSGYYAIENAGQLRWFGSNCNTSYSSDPPINAVLVANITDNEKVTENGALISDVSGLREWTPLGTDLLGYFYGVFDGNGKYISGLYKSNDSGSAALFEDSYGTIKNLTLKDTYFRAYGNQASRAGAFALFNGGTIENCASYAIISGKYSDFVGMFAGLGGSNGKITSSFAAYPMIITSGERYSFYGTDSSSDSDANITKSYYLSNGTGLREKTAEEFANGSVAYLLGDAWGQNIGTDLFPVLGGAKIYTSYPCVKEYSNTPFAVENSHSFENLVCTDCGESQLLATEDNYAELGVTSDYIGYFVISNVDHFIWLSEHISKGNKDANAILTADMDFTGKSWTPITEFSGTFDGGGHRIKNLRVNLASVDASFAIFALLSDGAVIRNLVIDSSSSIFSTGSTGALAYNVSEYATVLIENCGNEANVSSNGYTAGLIRYNNVSARVNLKNCYNTGAISGNPVNSVSGLVQGGFYNTFINCYNIGTLTGPKSDDNIEALGSASSITNSYSLTNQGTQISIEDVTSGKLAWLLNEGKTDGTQAFYQTAGSEIPTFSGATVYRRQLNCADYEYTNNSSFTESSEHKGDTLIFAKYDDSTHNKVYECCGAIVETGFAHTAEGSVTCLGTYCSICEAYFGAKNPELHASNVVEYVNTANGIHKKIYTCCEKEEAGLDCDQENGICKLCKAYSIPTLTEDTYYIGNAGQLLWWLDNGIGNNASLTSDINLEGFAWQSEAFSTIFDGQGFTIYNLSPDGIDHGLFSLVYGTVKNLGIVNPNMPEDTSSGIICDYLVNGKISNCFTIIENEELKDKIPGFATSIYDGIIEYSFTTQTYDIDGSTNNVYFISDSGASNAMTAEEAANGKLAFHLGEAWGQTIGTDALPVLGGAKVYRNQTGGCSIAKAVYSYSNTSAEPIFAHADENTDHVCDFGCGKEDISIDLHLDSENDDDHLCDYGCGAVLEACTPGTDDGDCTTAVPCLVCGEDAIAAKPSHTPDVDDGDCLTAVECTLCDKIAIEAKASHTPGADDGDCTTAVKCANCDKIAIEAKASHTASADDGDCTTAVKCANCDKNAIEAKATHTAGADDGDCTTAVKCANCDKIAIDAKASHTAGADDGDCTTAVKCANCDKIATEAKASHTAGADDGDCTTAVKCADCDKIAIEAKSSHSGGTASCTEKAKCALCAKEYGELLAHSDSMGDGKCDACNYQISTGGSGNTDTPEEDKGLSGGVIAGISAGSAAALGTGGFSLFWFGIKKRKWSDLVNVFKKKD